MKTRNAPAMSKFAHLVRLNRVFRIPPVGLSVRVGAILVLVGLLIISFYSPSSAFSFHKVFSGGSARTSDKSQSSDANVKRALARISSLYPSLYRRGVGRTWLTTPQPPLAETIATFAADCTTPRSSFLLGETVCAKTDNVDLNFPGGRWVHWLRQDLSIAHGGNGTTDITTNPQFFSFAPDALGTWKVTIAQTGDISQTPAVFTVSSTLATYESGCGLAQSSFSLGDAVCARVAGVNPLLNRRLFWIDPAGFARAVTPISTDPQDASFTLPATQTSIVGDTVVDNRGTWKVNLVTLRGSVLFSVPFTVSGVPVADLGVTKAIIGPAPDPGAQFKFFVQVSNFGPNDAANVVFTDPQPANATFDSIIQTSGPTSPAFSCLGTDPVVCTRVLGLAAGASASFEITYVAGAAGASITNTATVQSDTTELNSADNSTSYGPIIINGGGGTSNTCTLGCPSDVVVTATGTLTVVNFSPDVEISGTCGTTITTDPVSGSTFPVGSTPVTVRSSEGGGECIFHVIVVDTAPPTIDCPLATLNGVAPAGATETAVSVTPPNATGNFVVVTGSRSDNREVTDPYPVGKTVITWTAATWTGNGVNDHPDGRTALCSQLVIVTPTDSPTITCPLSQNKTFTTADCAYTPVSGDIVTPAATGNGVTVEGIRSDHLALTDAFPAGTTVITWTATDNIGRTVSCTQTITVNSTGDHTPPTLTIPPDLNVTTATCSPVLLDDELGVATASDTCSAVSITRTGVPLTACALPNVCPIACPTQADPGRTCNENFFFPVGTTDVTYTAKDAAGNTTTGVQHVTVHELTPPTFTFVPGNVGPVNNDPGLCGAVVSDAMLGPMATVSDNCDTTVIRSGVPAGNIFPVGDTIVTYTAKADITVFRTQKVTVVDNTPPAVTAPTPVTLYTGSGATSCGVTVTDLNGTFGTGSATDNCPGVGPVTRSGVPALNFFPVGPTTLTYSATDAHNNTGSANQLVTVVDNTPPTISCQANIIVDFNPAVTGTVVTYTTPVGTDNCASTTTQIAGLPSGSAFPVGTTTNTFQVKDASNNTAQCSFKVTVALTSIIGLDNASLTGNALVDSYDSTGGYPATKGSLANFLSNGTVTVAGSSKVFGNVRSTRVGVVVSGTSQVTGNATAGTTVTKGTSAIIGGTITNGLLGAVMTLPSVPACSPFSSNSGITGTYTYNSSTGDLTLSGINNATLANGNYCFHNVTLTNSGQLKVNGLVTIRLTGTLSTSGATSLPNTTLIPSNLRILSSFSGSNGVTFGNSSSLQLVVYAPNTNVSITGSAPLFGTVVGKTVTVSNSGMIHYDTQLKSIWPDIWTLIFGP